MQVSPCLRPHPNRLLSPRRPPEGPRHKALLGLPHSRPRKPTINSNEQPIFLSRVFWAGKKYMMGCDHNQMKKRTQISVFDVIRHRTDPTIAGVLCLHRGHSSERTPAPSLPDRQFFSRAVVLFTASDLQNIVLRRKTAWYS